MRTLAIAIAIASAPMSPVEACLPLASEDRGRYVGGDLAAQVVAKASSIQIVRAAERRFVARTPAPIYSYLFKVIETLKGGGEGRRRNQFRIVSASFEEEHDRAVRIWYAGPWIHPERFDAPGEPMPMPRSSQFVHTALDIGLAGAGNACRPDLRLAVGDTYVVLRDEAGAPFFATGDRPGLPIDATFGGVRVTFDAPALVRITGPDDPYLVRLRGALAGRADDRLTRK